MSWNPGVQFISTVCLLTLSVGCMPSGVGTASPKANPINETTETKPTAKTKPTETVPSLKSTKNQEPDTTKLPTELAPGDFAIGGVDLTLSEAEVVEQFGEADRRRSYLGVPNARLEYEGLTVDLRDGGVAGIATTDGDLCTPSGLCPGQSLESVFERLGPTDIYDDEKGMRAVYIPAKEDNIRACWMAVHLESSNPGPSETVSQLMVNQLLILCQP